MYFPKFPIFRLLLELRISYFWKCFVEIFLSLISATSLSILNVYIFTFEGFFKYKKNKYYFYHDILEIMHNYQWI